MIGSPIGLGHDRNRSGIKRTCEAAVFADLLLLAGRGSGEGYTRGKKHMRRRRPVDDGDVEKEVITTEGNEQIHLK